MVLISEMFVSELLGTPVVDQAQETLGRVKDILINQGEKFPKVTGLLVAIGKEKKILPMESINLIGRQFVSTRTVKTQVSLLDSNKGNFLLLLRDVMDQQVVDLEGARVIRVNDLKLAKLDQGVRLIAADVGLRGMLRRLGLEKVVSWVLHFFHQTIPEQLISWDHVQSLAGGKIAISSKGITGLHPADIAQIISQLDSGNKAAILALISEETAAETLHELEPMLAAVLLAKLDTKKTLDILEKMPIDGIADILGDLPLQKSEELLACMDSQRASQLRELLKYQDETAGGLMTTEFITLHQEITCAQVIEQLRTLEPSAEAIYYLYVVDAARCLVGVLSLRNLIIAKPDKPISEIMFKDPISISPAQNRREVAAIISKYNLLAVPVVDDAQKILGIITVDDVIDFILPPVSKRKRKMLG